MNLWDGLKLWYRFDESSGAIICRDSSPSAKHGDLTATPSFNAQRFNKGVVFNGSTQFAQATGFTVPSAAFTMSFWCKQLSYVANARIIDWQESGPVGGFSVVQTSNAIFVTFRNGSTQVASLATGIADTDLTNRHHILITYNGTIATLYVDGVQVAQDTSSTMTVAATTLTFGRRSASSSNFANVELDDFRMYDRVLSTEEITALYGGDGFYEAVVKEKKSYEYKIYSKEGHFIKTWTDVANDPEFTVVINGGFVEAQIRLARKTENFGEDVDVKFGNEVQIWCFDDDAPNGVKIFSGYISRYDPLNDGPEDRVVVYCLGFHTTLKDFMYEDAQGGTQITHNSKDPGEIAEDILDKLEVFNCPVDWTETTLQKTGSVVSYAFQANTGMEALDKVLTLTPAGWYWYVDADKNFHLHPKPEHAIHTFTLGKDLFYMQPQKRIENVINKVYFFGGIPDGQTQQLFGRYERPNSIQNYGLKAVKKTDQRVKLQGTMDIIANNILDAFQDLEIRTTIRVKDNNYDPDNGYDIESIKVGDTCQIRNYQDLQVSSKWDVDFWDVGNWDFNIRNISETIMQIVEIRYRPDFVELVISSKIPDVSKRIEDINRNLVDSIISNAPANPVLGSEI